MSSLAFYLLGAPRLEKDGKPVEFDTRKATALLAYLAISGEQPRRDSLAAFLWPEQDQARARASLRRTLSALRKGIGEGCLVVDLGCGTGVLGLMSIQEVAHRLETLLDLARSGKHPLGPAEVDVVLKSVDLLPLMIRELPACAAGQVGTDVSRRRRELLEMVNALIAGGPAADAQPAAAAPHEAAAPAAAVRKERRDDAQSTVKVNTRKLDALLDMVGELVIAQSILAEDPVLVRSLDERLNDRLAQLKRITSELQRSAMAMRMVPIRQTFQKMARLVAWRKAVSRRLAERGRAAAPGGPWAPSAGASPRSRCWAGSWPASSRWRSSRPWASAWPPRSGCPRSRCSSS